MGFTANIILHLRHIVQYIYAIVFKRIFWNKPRAIASSRKIAKFVSQDVIHGEVRC